MVEVRQSIPVEEAISRIMEKVKVGPIEKVDLLNAYGRYLGENLIADHDVPLFDRSIVDGFAIRAEDTNDSEQRITLKVKESIGAGYVAKSRVELGEAVRIMTGAPIPDGANAIVMLEHVDENNSGNDTLIELTQLHHFGENIAPQGEDIKNGTELFSKGRRIGAGDMALLATFGYDQVSVYKQPVIGILATGSELVEIGQPLAPGKIRNSNSLMLQGQIQQLGAIPKYYGILADNLEESIDAVNKALTEVDYLITTGGVSVGDYDFIPAILEKLQAEVLFNKVEMRPGSVTTVAYKEGKWIFGLSGNPSACYVGLELFVRPILTTYLGSSNPHLRKKNAVLTSPIGKQNPYARFVRAKVTTDEATCFVTPIGIEKSGIVSSLAEANGLLVVPPHTKSLSIGDHVEVICFETVADYF